MMKFIKLSLALSIISIASLACLFFANVLSESDATQYAKQSLSILATLGISAALLSFLMGKGSKK